MGTVYITQDDAFIGKTDERLSVKANKQRLLDVPLIKVDGVVVMGRATVSPAVVIELLERKIPLTFLTRTGRYLGSLESPLSKNIYLRSAQWDAAREESKTLTIVRSFIRGKLKNYRSSLLRLQREVAAADVQGAIDGLGRSIDGLAAMGSVDTLRGLEGNGSALYFGCFGQLIRAEGFSFSGRNRRPPTDPVNALLSFGYALLLHDVQSAVTMVGFDPYLGYLHAERYGRPSLALDVMEEFRPLVVDAVVLAAINKRSLVPEDFEQEPISGAVSLSDEGRRTFLRLYEQKKQSAFKHPVLQRKCTYQEAFEVQARLLAKFLMGSTDKYPPLILR
jgi:CRISPR-associated protein Cas1